MFRIFRALKKIGWILLKFKIFKVKYPYNVYNKYCNAKYSFITLIKVR